MAKYTIKSELGMLADIDAPDVDAAKDIYTEKYGFDFEGCDEGKFPGSWYWISEDGVRVADCTAEMP